MKTMELRNTASSIIFLPQQSASVMRWGHVAVLWQLMLETGTLNGLHRNWLAGNQLAESRAGRHIW